MVWQMNVLDRNLNVQDSYLLEASAGTGKTFSIENIVARLLIDGEKPLLLDQILIVTFTKAATSDLKKRIRQNIEKALHFFKTPSSEDQKPDYIEAHIEKGETAIQFAISKLKTALFTFDDAQIFTIHSFCSKMLHDNTIEGGISIGSKEASSSLTNMEVIDIIRNFFRTELTPNKFSQAQINCVLKKHKSDIEKVEKALLKWILKGLEIKKTADFQELFQEFLKFMKNFNFEKEKIIADFENQIGNYKKLKDHAAGFAKITEFANLFEKDILTEADFDRLIQNGLYLLEALDPQQLKVKTKPLEKPLFYPDLVAQLKEKLLPLVEEASSYECIFSRMAKASANLLQNYLIEEEKFRFDDLLKYMKEALKNDQFLDSVRKRYKACIIDEFQDTDQIQWDIFNTLFTGISPIYLVGDPKQSIYSFRQADIYTYLQAANTIQDNHKLSLDTNFRSQPSLTSCLNALFEKSVNPEFIELPRLETVLDFVKVKSPATIPEYPFTDDLGSVHFYIAEAANKFDLDEIEKYYFPFIAEQIQNLKSQGFKPSEMAILVKDQFQAKRVLDYMQEKGFALALQRLSNLSESAVLPNLIELLSAIISPRDESALKKALGSPLIGFTSQEILSLKDPLIFENILDKFFYFRSLLYSFGFSSFFQAFIRSSFFSDLNVAETLMSRENGADIYDDLLQISELVSEHQSETKATVDDLLCFLKEFDLLSFDSDDRMKKLKDPNLEAIKVLTIHSSKGLEFEIVFALGLINRTPLPDTLIPVEICQKTILEPLTDKTSKNYLDHCKELDAEKLRQLYVAMTRAKHRLYVPVAFCLKGKEIEPPSASCMELFLSKMKPFRNHEISLYENILNLNSTNFISFIETLESSLKFTYSKLNEMSFSFGKSEKQHTFLIPPEEVNILDESMFMTSFTKVSTKKYSLNTNLEMPHDYNSIEKNKHNLPTGRKTGILFHSILESFPFEKYTDITHADELASFTHSFLNGTKFENWQNIFNEILFNLLNCRLDSFKFKDIDKRKIYCEQEFIYPQANVNGYMNGIIDFMFMHEDKYYFIDWKSNWLGTSDEDYCQENLKQSMTENDYYLQATIYKEAITRFLSIVDEREFEDCFGGIFYVFLRGLSANNPDNGVLFFK